MFGFVCLSCMTAMTLANNGHFFSLNGTQPEHLIICLFVTLFSALLITVQPNVLKWLSEGTFIYLKVSTTV